MWSWATPLPHKMALDWLPLTQSGPLFCVLYKINPCIYRLFHKMTSSSLCKQNQPYINAIVLYKSNLCVNVSLNSPLQCYNYILTKMTSCSGLAVLEWDSEWVFLLLDLESFLGSWILERSRRSIVTHSSSLLLTEKQNFNNYISRILGDIHIITFLQMLH